eukprot:4753087-Pleurochrysis_carterae.AAC.1
MLCTSCSIPSRRARNASTSRRTPRRGQLSVSAEPARPCGVIDGTFCRCGRCGASHHNSRTACGRRAPCAAGKGAQPHGGGFVGARHG